MATLVEQLGNGTKRPAVIKDCVELIDAQVKQRGFIIKGAYSTIKAIKKGFVEETVDSMLDEWLGEIQPHYEKWDATKGTSLPDFMVARGDDIAEDLLKVTDRRAEKTSHTTAKKMCATLVCITRACARASRIIRSRAVPVVVPAGSTFTATGRSSARSVAR